jgi:hypothetical protein
MRPAETSGCAEGLVMIWKIRTWRQGGRNDRVVHVRARCTALRAVEDVSLDCGPGVQAVDLSSAVRRGMTGFSTPIEGTFRWDADIDRPEVIITWSDMGEPSQQRIPLTSALHDAAGRPALLGLLRARS